jgi:DNA-binding NtrC family response regulator
MKVLLVDDDPAPLRVLHRALSRVATVECAASADDALRLLDAHRFDAVVTDYDMPGGHDGLWLLDRVRERDARIRRVLTSACGPERLDAEPRCEVIQSFVAKPVRLQELLAAIEQQHAKTLPSTP